MNADLREVNQMKEHISPQDLNKLTPAQKEMLRSLWKPAVNDRAVASICINAETDEYKDIEFVVGQILINDTGYYPRFVLRRLRLMDYQTDEEDIAPEADVDTDAPAGLPAEDDDRYEDQDEDDEAFDALYIEPDEFYNLEDCLPLLSVGQMMDFIRKSRFGQRGYKLIVPPEENKLFEQKLFRLEDSDGEGYENEELCDLLWEVFKTYVLGVL